MIESLSRNFGIYFLQKSIRMIQRLHGGALFPIVIVLFFLFSVVAIHAVTENDPSNREELAKENTPDSLIVQRAELITKETGLTDADDLIEAAEKLEVASSNFNKWKSALGLEAKNEALDKRSLRQLGISVYQAALAQQSVVFGFNESNTLTEIANIKQIPVKKLKAMLDLSALDRNIDNLSIQALRLKPEQITEISEKFYNRTVLYGSSITLVGMLIVFSSLALISIIISQFHLFNKKDESQDTKIIITRTGKIKSAPRDLNRDTIVAAITALHIHIQSIEERRKLLLTFKRTPINLWHSTNVINMPNRAFIPPRRHK